MGGELILTYHVAIKNLDELQANFEKAPQTYDREVSRAINKSLVRYQASAKTLAPVDTGRLRASILVIPARRTGVEIRGSVSTDVHYAIFQELGTSRGVPARLYMQGALDQNEPAKDRDFEEAAEHIANALAEGQAA